MIDRPSPEDEDHVELLMDLARYFKDSAYIFAEEDQYRVASGYHAAAEACRDMARYLDGEEETPPDVAMIGRGMPGSRHAKYGDRFEGVPWREND